MVTRLSMVVWLPGVAVKPKSVPSLRKVMSDTVTPSGPFSVAAAVVLSIVTSEFGLLALLVLVTP
jgi:hypothetical protein